VLFNSLADNPTISLLLN